MPKAKPHTEVPADHAAVAQERRVVAALRVIAETPPEAFDGHTEFVRLRPAERLAWMEGALVLIESRRRGGAGGVSSEQ